MGATQLVRLPSIVRLVVILLILSQSDFLPRAYCQEGQKAKAKVDGVFLGMLVAESEAVQAQFGRKLVYYAGRSWFQESDDIADSGNRGPRIWLGRQDHVVRVQGEKLTVAGKQLQSRDSIEEVQGVLGQPAKQARYADGIYQYLVFVYADLNLAVRFNVIDSETISVQSFLLDDAADSLTFLD